MFKFVLSVYFKFYHCYAYLMFLAIFYHTTYMYCDYFVDFIRSIVHYNYPYSVILSLLENEVSQFDTQLIQLVIQKLEQLHIHDIEDSKIQCVRINEMSGHLGHFNLICVSLCRVTGQTVR